MSRPVSSRRRILVSGAIGSTLEWYDFGVYAFLATVLAQYYFPTDNPAISLIATFGVFAGGYLMRPIGGILLGHIGDRVSRKSALIISVTAMSVATSAIAVLPDYTQIGFAAPLLLTVLRLFQGLAVGGEYTGAVVFLVEAAPSNRRAFFASIALAAGTVGVLLASGAVAFASFLMDPAMFESWGWRLLYAPAPILGIAGLLLRMKLQIPEQETPVQTRETPVVEVLRNHWRSLSRLIALAGAGGIANYTVFVYGATYMETVANLPRSVALNINTAALATLIVFVVTAAWISDRVGRRPVMLISLFCVAASAVPLFLALRSGDVALSLGSLVVFAVFLGGCAGALSGIMCELFPRAVRYTGTSLGYSLAVGIGGGTAPLIAEALFAATGNSLSPGYYVLFAALIGAAVMLITPETRGKLPD